MRKKSTGSFGNLLLCFVCSLSFAQTPKKSINYSTADYWPVIKNELISNDGKYVCYSVSSIKGGGVLAIQSTDNPWRITIHGGKNSVFTGDSKFFIFQNSADSVGILSFQKKQIDYVHQASSFQVLANIKSNYLTIMSKSEGLILYNLQSKKHIVVKNAINYLFSKDGKSMVYQVNDPTIPNNFKLMWHDLLTGKSEFLYEGNRALNLVFDESGQNLAFSLESNNDTKNSIRVYRRGVLGTKTLVDSSTSGMEHQVVHGAGMYFSKTGDRLFFYSKPSDTSLNRRMPANAVRVDIWNYKEDIGRGNKQLVLGAMDVRQGPAPGRALLSMIFNKERSKVIPLERDEDSWIIKDQNENYIVGIGNKPRPINYNSSEGASSPDVYLVNTYSGERTLIVNQLLTNISVRISPSGRFIYWFDQEKNSWFTFNIKTRIIANVSKKISEPVTVSTDAPVVRAEGSAGWTTNDDYILIYGRNNLWKIDPTGEHSPVNLTAGYAKSGNIRFRVFNFDKNKKKSGPISENLLLSAFDRMTKNTGFYRLSFKGTPQLQCLTMGSANFLEDARTEIENSTRFFYPVKAKDADVFMVKPMNANTYPNLCVTKNFKKFDTLSHLAPQKEYNWYTNELIKWEYDGHEAEGILYKPENFDPDKKYPLIFYYYEKNSDALNSFIQPFPSAGALNIPWYVSNGYIVFVPDIVFYKLGDIGEEVLKVVTSATDHLIKFPWVDSEHIGLQGHSFGGYETNYLISHSQRFAAATSCSGLVNLSSAYTKMFGGNTQYYFETGQQRLGASLGEKPNVYIANSPIFNVAKVKTPLLLMYNREDESNWQQGYDWYRNLKREGKKVWMLQYDKDGHILSEYNNQLDFTIRMSQFFDHYLKGKPAPVWMTKGIPDSRKGIDTGYQLDPGIDP